MYTLFERFEELRLLHFCYIDIQILNQTTINAR